MSSRKRALKNVMTVLDEEVESGNVNEGAQLRLAKGLKTAYDAKETSKREHIKSYLVAQFVEYPATYAVVATPYAKMVRCPYFMVRLLDAKQKQMGREPIPDWWWDNLMGSAIDFDNDEVDDIRANIVTFAMLGQFGHEVFPHLQRRLNACLDHSPVELFPLGPPGFETDERGQPLRRPSVDWNMDDLPHGSTWCALATEPRLLLYLLKPAHGYSALEAERLRAFAFYHSSCEPEWADAEWRKLVGLSCADECDACMDLICDGKLFADARRQVLRSEH